MHWSPLEAPEQETGSLTRSGASGARRRGAGRGRWRLSGPVGGVKMGPGRLVAHARSMRDKWLYRASFALQNRPLDHPSGVILIAHLFHQILTFKNHGCRRNRHPSALPQTYQSSSKGLDYDHGTKPRCGKKPQVVQHALAGTGPRPSRLRCRRLRLLAIPIGPL